MRLGIALLLALSISFSAVFFYWMTITVKNSFLHFFAKFVSDNKAYEKSGGKIQTLSRLLENIPESFLISDETLTETKNGITIQISSFRECCILSPEKQTLNFYEKILIMRTFEKIKKKLDLEKNKKEAEKILDVFISDK